jgi:hypothetical protein
MNTVSKFGSSINAEQLSAFQEGHSSVNLVVYMVDFISVSIFTP